MRELVPELHDVLKLTHLNHDINKGGKDYETFKNSLPKSENVPTWKGVVQHHLWFKRDYPREPDTFLLRIADDLAGSLSRAEVTGEVEKDLSISKLWKPEEKREDVKLKEDKEIISLFKFLSCNPSWKEFLQKPQYKHILKNRPEDERQGRNIVSLYTHCKLTGQFYRLLKNHPSFSVSSKEFEGKRKKEKRKKEIGCLINQKEKQEWKLTLVDCKFRFHQAPFRVRDLNIFSALEGLTQRIAACYPDNVLFKTSDEMLLVLPDESILKNNIAPEAFKEGFWIEIVNEKQRPLNELSKALLQKPIPGENLYNLPSQIFPICELCQSAKATKHWPEDYVLSYGGLCPRCRELLSQNPLSSLAELLCEADKTKLEDIIEEPLREDLCENCFSLRVEGVKLRKLDKWTEERQAKVAWLKLNLDIDQLVETLRNLHPKKAEIRFSVISEFQEDYSNFLWEFNDQIQNDFSSKDVENIMSDFFCIKIGNFKETFKILQACHVLFKKFFPAFLNLENSPLKIAIVCANPKFPFFEVWRTVKEAQEDIFVSLQGKRTMRAPINALEVLVKAANMPYRKSALHKLAKIEETSETLAELTFQNKKDKDYRHTYSRLDKTLRPKLDFSSIFTFAQLIE